MCPPDPPCVKAVDVDSHEGMVILELADNEGVVSFKLEMICLVALEHSGAGIVCVHNKTSVAEHRFDFSMCLDAVKKISSKIEDAHELTSTNPSGNLLVARREHVYGAALKKVSQEGDYCVTVYGCTDAAYVHKILPEQLEKARNELLACFSPKKKRTAPEDPPPTEKKPRVLPPGVTLRVESDYDGIFEGEIVEALWKKHDSGAPIKHHKFIVTAGPYRGHDVCILDTAEPGTLSIDFYSASRYRGDSFKDDTEKMAML